MLTLRLAEGLAAVEAEAWDALVRPESSPFLKHALLAALEDTGCSVPERGWLPRPLLVEDARGRLRAAAPVYVKGSSEGEFVFDHAIAELAQRLGVAYYPKLLVAVPFTPATGARVLSAPDADAAEREGLLRAVGGGIAELAGELGLSSAHVLFPRPEEARALADAGLLARWGVQYHWENRGYGTFEDFLRDLPSKRRTMIRRERAAVAAAGLVVEDAREGELEGLAADMHALYLTTVDKFVWGRRYLTPAFFERVARTFAPHLAWAVARREGRIVASAFNVKDEQRLYGRYWGAFEEVPFLHFETCFYHGVERCIREGLGTFEPGAGGEHKRARGFVPTVTWSLHHFEHPRLRAAARDFFARERDAIAAHVREERAEAGAPPDPSLALDPG